MNGDRSLPESGYLRGYHINTHYVKKYQTFLLNYKTKVILLLKQTRRETSRDTSTIINFRVPLIILFN